ncbi:MAG: hypothetical protein AB7F91_13660 [Parvularculaceae bacterium]
MLRLKVWTIDSAQHFFRKRHWLREELKPFEDVMSIYARQVDAITFDENVLIFEMNDGLRITVGETDNGLNQLERTLRWFGVEGDWYSQLEQGGPGTELCLFQKMAKA